jgi:hypothetical protein
VKRRSLALVAVMAAGCVLDFDEFRVPAVASDAGLGRDAGFDAGLDAGDANGDRPDAPPEAAVVDLPRADDRGDPRCAPPGNALIRVAHMAVGLGTVDLCMRRQLSDDPFSAVPANDWPAVGVGYARVSQHIAINSPVLASNDRWQFVLVPHETDCAAASNPGVAVASLTVNIDPQSQSTLLLTSEIGIDGRVFGTLGLLSDQACTTCTANTLDIRAVHASLGAAADRVALSINYSLPARGPASFVNVLFANNIPYGQTAPVGGAGYDCDTAWRGAADLPGTYTVQIAAQTVSDEVLARSERVVLKGELLLRYRMATVFFLGGDGVRTPPPEFVLCYEGARDAGMTVCDRIAATAVPRSVGADGGAGPDAADAQHDADADVDAMVDAALDDVLL